MNISPPAKTKWSPNSTSVTDSHNCPNIPTAESPTKRPSMIDHQKPEKIQAAIRFLSSMLGLPEGELGPDSSMDNTPTWDSVEHMNICLLFERQFGIKMNMDIITSVTSIRALAELIP